jgi:hypothetical protein
MSLLESYNFMKLLKVLFDPYSDKLNKRSITFATPSSWWASV